MIVNELHRTGAGTDGRAEAYLRAYRKCGEDLALLLTPAANAELAGLPSPRRHVEPYLTGGAMTSLLNQLLHCNLRTKSSHHILTKVERLTAAAGVQGRSPLFDRRVIDYAFTVPPRWKLAGTAEKWILKEAVRDLLPATIIDRPKSGMQVPVQAWLGGPLRDLTHEVLHSPIARGRGLYRPETIREWLRGRGSVLPRQGGKLWLVLTLEAWLQSFGVQS